MEFKVIGKCIRKGEYEGRPWQKIQLTCEVLNPSANKFIGLEGIVTEVISCPYTEEFSKIAINDKVDFYYDKFGKVKSCRKGN